MLLTILLGFTLAADGQTWTQPRASCTADKPLSISILVDNSTTARASLNDASGLVGGELGLLAGLLRRGDVLRLFPLTEKRDEQPTALTVEIAGTDDSAKEGYANRLKRAADSLYERPAKATDLAVSLRNVADADPNATCARVILVIADGSLDPLETVHPRIELNRLRSAVQYAHAKGIQLFALGLRASRHPMIDAQYSEKLRTRGIAAEQYEDVMGDSLLRMTFGAPTVFDLRDPDVLDELFFSADQAIFRTRFTLSWDRPLVSQSASYVVYEAHGTNSNGFLTCRIPVDSSNSDTTHVVVFPTSDRNRCYHYVRSPTATLLKELENKASGIGWSGDSRIVRDEIPPVIRSGYQLTVMVDSTAAGECQAALWSAVRAGSWPSSRARGFVMVHFEGHDPGAAKDSLELRSVDTQPHCFAPVDPSGADVKLKALGYRSALLRFELRTAEGVRQDVVPDTRELDIAPVTNESPIQRVHAALFMPFNVDIWYLSGYFGSQQTINGKEVGAGNLLIGNSPTGLNSVPAASEECVHRPAGYACWRFGGFYDGALEPKTGRVVLGTHAIRCDRLGEDVPCRYIDLLSPEALPGDYGLLTTGRIFLVLLLAALLIQTRSFSVNCARALAANGLQSAKQHVYKPFDGHFLDVGSAAVKLCADTFILWVQLGFVVEAGIWAIRAHRDPSSPLASASSWGLLLGIILGELGMWVFLGFFRGLAHFSLTHSGKLSA